MNDEKSKTREGEGFVMKESSSDEASLHKLDFSTFVLSLATSALINLGLAPDPHTQKTEKNLEVARQNIELLAILKEKTQGNLTADEKQLLEGLLADVRLQFVQQSKQA